MRSILLMGALFAAAIGAFFYYQQRLESTKVKPKPVVHQDSAPASVATPLESTPNLPKELMWKLDERWTLSEERGKELIQEVRDLYEWQENVGGDPLRFRSEKKRLLKEMEPILEGLNALKAELAPNPGAAGLVETRIREFSNAMSGVLR